MAERKAPLPPAVVVEPEGEFEELQRGRVANSTRTLVLGTAKDRPALFESQVEPDRSRTDSASAAAVLPADTPLDNRKVAPVAASLKGKRWCEPAVGRRAAVAEQIGKSR